MTTHRKWLLTKLIIANLVAVAAFAALIAVTPFSEGAEFLMGVVMGWFLVMMTMGVWMR